MYLHSHSFIELLKRDRRYKAEAYAFVFETLEYAQNVLNLGKNEANEPISEELIAENEELRTIREHDEQQTPDAMRHITGQDLCRAACLYATEQYGLLAKMVLDSVGIRKTSDIGEIVYNLIRIGLMRKTAEDRREDFDDVLDFETAFDEEYRFKG